MKNYFDNYIHSISKKFSYEETSEMGYRADFEILLREIFEKINVKRIDNDPRGKDGNRPDFVIHKHNIPILYIETKTVGTDLGKIEKSEQLARYYGYANLVLTDYVEFRFYRNGIKYEEPIKIAECNLKKKTLEPLSNSFNHLSKTLIDFTQSHKEPIRSALHLAKIMGGKAQRIRDNIRHYLSEESEKNTEIMKIYSAIKKQLVHDLTLEAFSDMYAQTVVYGLFVARYYDESPENFNRREASELVPKSNPLLRNFFNHIVGPDFDKRLEPIVNELCEVFSHANVQELMKQYFKDDLWGETHEGPDPVIHFYEDFLKEYDPELRKKLGAFYTPTPVVRFIVRSVDYILEKEFGLPNGLADTSKLENGIHRVQILDPAAGTGTFISAAIRIIYQRILNEGQKGRWPAYVHHDLLPRLHGFELMMAPYTIAHLKLGMAFKQTGFWKFYNRLGIYLTNSLEENVIKDDDLWGGFGFAESISEESKEASKIKNRTPIMVVIGNPPYSVSSSNKSKWILDLIKDYKKNLNEQNIQPLSDDYIKFIRFAEHFIEKKKSGIVAMITNNTFLDGNIHRQMRKHLLETFDEIYILDLHGNSKKKEKAPDGSKDENVFDIQQGVAISIFIRKKNDKKKLGNVYHSELFGVRENKFEELTKNDLHNTKWKKLDYSEPYYFFVPKNFTSEDDYDLGFSLKNLFLEFGSGIKFRKDNLLVKNHYSPESVEKMLVDMRESDNTFMHTKYNFKDTSDWILNDKRKLFLNANKLDVHPVLYRPFETRYTYYPLDKINEIIPRGDSRWNLMKYFLLENNLQNLCLLSTRQLSTYDFQHVFVTRLISDMCSISLQTKETSYAFPLYIYSNDGTKHPNFNQSIVDAIEKTVGKTEPEEILDYIYAVLHSPSYREKYKEFLKIDFPRVPYPKDKKTFKELVQLGTELRLLHLMESLKLNKLITTYPVSGSDEVEKPVYKDGNVYINKEQYFGKVPETAWNFYIGGYQPAQKWLKDRKGRQLTNDDIVHYQKIIVALTETDRLMKEIDKIVKKII